MSVAPRFGSMLRVDTILLMNVKLGCRLVNQASMWNLQRVKTFLCLRLEWCGWAKTLEAEPTAGGFVATAMRQIFYCPQIGPFERSRSIATFDRPLSHYQHQ